MRRGEREDSGRKRLDQRSAASIRTGVVDSRFAFVSRAGSTRYGYVVGGVLIIPGQSGGQLSTGFNGVAETGVADDRFDVGVNFQYWGA